MKSDLDALMEKDNLDALLVVGPAFHNPPMVYLTGGGHVSDADLIKKRGETGHLYCGAMERDEAARSGLTIHTNDMAQLRTDLQETGGDWAEAGARRYQRIFSELGLTSGRVGVLGQTDAGRVWAVFSRLLAQLPELEIVGQMQNNPIRAAMATKDQAEIARIRRMGQITTEVIGEVADFVTGHRTRDEILVKSDGQPLTIGDVRRRINLWLIERGVENPEGTIFAIGRDAGVPHSAGNDGDALRLGRTIVFDIFPCEAGGGYYYDMTRTWSLGYATDAALKLYEDVRTVYDQLYAELKLGGLARGYQVRCCELFEARGHPTVLTNPNTTDGYNHGLGHGVGLNIHELPNMGNMTPETMTLEAGNVITLEPGLYYPERGMGVRLEDTLWARPDGVFEVLAPYPMDLVLPMR
jgi:Xaa-Pro aminopeptidase